MARFGSDSYVRPPYRQRRAARLRALVVALIAAFALLLLALVIFLFSSAHSAPLPDVNAWNLRTVHSDTPLPDDFSVTAAALPDDYLSPDAAQGESMRFDARAYDALCAMLAAAREKGHSPVVTRAYCSVQAQRALFKAEQRRLRQEEGLNARDAYARALQTLGDPNASEYALGLCVDLYEKSAPDSPNDVFSQTPLYEWLVKNAARYGFILRYPESCAEQTQHAFDAHCFRYVGRQAAQRIAKKSLCLETYLDDLIRSAAQEAQDASDAS